MNKNYVHKLTKIEKAALKIPKLVGTPLSLMMHTLAFGGIFGLIFFGVPIERILIILTSILSVEAIYLSLLIQMTVNQHTSKLEGVEEDIEDLQEEVEDISEDIDKFQTETGMDKLKKLITLDPLRKRGLI